ncbi:Hypothetical protein SMAX5B_012089 [Scophthalmus maximus]|uniref:Uncharacterized protein n=1 Tax=Scophthalmus maximus TaxID=52904 RepID=A0A2U9AXD1_SCOMX|nr:Hypothetical protein SMAX5B_012089 [Scophthalmus maximus]
MAPVVPCRSQHAELQSWPLYHALKRSPKHPPTPAREKPSCGCLSLFLLPLAAGQASVGEKKR